MKIVDSAKNVVKRFKSPSSKEDVSMNKCDVTLFVLLSFIILYGIFIMVRPFSSSSHTESTPASIVQPNSSQATQHIEKPFEVGEIVGVKHLNVYGIITQKILSFSGYRYEVTYKNNDHDVQKVELEKWMLFRPTEHDLNAHLLSD